MDMTYKQDLYKTKEREIYDMFLEFLVPVMKNIEHPALIEEWIENIHGEKVDHYYMLS